MTGKVLAEIHACLLFSSQVNFACEANTGHNEPEGSVVVAEVVRYKNAAACGQVIRGMRRERNLSLKDLSKTSGLPYQYLSRIERGEVNTPIETLTIIAQSLKVPTRQFFPSDKTVTPAQLYPLIDNCPPNRLYVLFLLLTMWK